MRISLSKSALVGVVYPVRCPLDLAGRSGSGTLRSLVLSHAIENRKKSDLVMHNARLTLLHDEAIKSFSVIDVLLIASRVPYRSILQQCLDSYTRWKYTSIEVGQVISWETKGLLKVCFYYRVRTVLPPKDHDRKSWSNFGSL